MATLGDEDVCRLDVAVDNTFSVSGVERVGDINCNRKQHFEIQRAARDAVLQRDALEIFHRDERPSGFFADVVDRADVRVIQSGGRLRFALKPAERLRVAGNILRQEL